MSSIPEIEKRWFPETTKAVELRPGYTVRVHQRIQEGKKERVQVFEGLIIDMKGTKGPNCMIRVRRISSGVGVERVFPVFSPRIEKILVVRKAKVRRANLRYMRTRSGKSARLREELVGSGDAAVAVASAPAAPNAPAAE